MPSAAWKGKSSRPWSRVRAAVLAENERTNDGRCTQQIRGVCTGRAEQVHHVLGRALTGDDVRYLRASCRACNLHIGEPGKVSPRPRPVTRW